MESLGKNGLVESFNGKLRDQALNREQFDTVPAAKVLVVHRGWEYNQVLSHCVSGYRHPASESIVPMRA